jgi:putative endonuclease
MPYYVYFLTTKRDGPLYCGVTNDLVRRTWEHQEGVVPGSTSQYQAKNWSGMKYMRM